MKYKIMWKSRLTEKCSSGIALFTKEEAETIAEQSNKTHENIYHYVVPAQDSDNDSIYTSDNHPTQS